MVLAPSKTVFETYADVNKKGSRICTYASLELEVDLYYPEVRDFLELLDHSKEYLLDDMTGDEEDFKKCDALLLPKSHYQIAVAQNATYCDKSRLIVNDFDLPIPNVMYLSQTLNEARPDLLNRINMYIKNGTYTIYYHDKYFHDFKDVDFNVDKYKEDKEEELDGTSRKLLGDTLSIANLDDQSDSSNFCSTSSETELSAMNPKEMSTPIILTLACTLIGMLLYFIERKKIKKNGKYNKIHDNPSAKEQHQAELYDILNTAENLPIRALVTKLNEQNVPSNLISEALNALPDKSSLINLVIEEDLSQASRRYEELSKKSISELHTIAEKTLNWGTMDSLLTGDDIEEALKSDNPKRDLIEIITKADSEMVPLNDDKDSHRYGIGIYTLKNMAN